MQKIDPKAGQKILLLDYDYDQAPEFEKSFPHSSFIYLKQKDLENELINLFKQNSFDPETTLVVCVGQSSFDLFKRLRTRMVFRLFSVSYAHAERVYQEVKLPGGKTSYTIHATVGQITRKLKRMPFEGRENYKKTSIRNIVVIDDVISTGITLKTLYERNHLYYPNASWHAFTLVSRLQKVKHYKSVSTPCSVSGKFTPINTFSKLVEDKVMGKEYVKRHVAEIMQGRTIEMLDVLHQECIFTPHVFCFDLFNTLAVETNNVQNLKIPSYLDYFVGEYGEKYHFRVQDVYRFVRDNLMTKEYKTFGEMTLQVFNHFVPNEECFLHDTGSIAYNVARYWELGSGTINWIDSSISQKLQRLKVLGHKVTLITNCTYPAWQMVQTALKIDRYKKRNFHFDDLFVSSIQGISKPNVEVWEQMEKRFPLFARNKFVMIGDSCKDDLEVPEKRGWITILADKICFEEVEKIFFH